MDFVYPEVFEGCEVLWAPKSDVSPFQWILGKVYRLKNESCDIKVERPTGIEFRENVIHADDPRLKTMKDNPIRGVFKLSQRELDIRQIVGKVNDLDVRVSTLQRTVENMNMQSQKPSRFTPKYDERSEAALQR